MLMAKCTPVYWVAARGVPRAALAKISRRSRRKSSSSFKVITDSLMRCSRAITLSMVSCVIALSGFCDLPTDVGLDKGRLMKLSAIRSFSGFHKGTFSPDAKSLALVDRAHIDVFEASSGRMLVSLARPKTSFLGARFSPDGRVLATAYKGEE